MEIPATLTERVESLSAELRIRLAIEKWWPNDLGSGFYGRVHGLIHDSESIRLEVVCSVSAGTGKDDVDLFILLNGTRVAPVTSNWDYLHRQGTGEFRLVCDDMGYDGQIDLDTLLLRKSVD